MKSFLLSCFLYTSVLHVFAQKKEPVNIGVIGLTHSHVHWIFNSDAREEFRIAGIVETDLELAAKYAAQYHFSMNMVYPTIEQLIEKTDLQAVTAFGNIYDHLKVVEICAPRGIHVMVEKPLAVSLKHALKMEALAKKYGIHLLTNYETTWYSANHEAFALLKNDSIGTLKKVIVRDGHRGPKKIGVAPEFLNWLTNPVLNGGGAITDFGCYGTNLLTWLAGGKIPLQVMAVTHQLQPANNPEVDDEAVIVVTYPEMIGIIQASWNWPIGRKDMELHGTKGVLFADNRYDLRFRKAEGYDGFSEMKYKLSDRPAPYDDPFIFFAAIINKEILMKPYDLSSLENNMVAMRILDAAIRSAKTGRVVRLK